LKTTTGNYNSFQLPASSTSNPYRGFTEVRN
jgi:hypothetical protein